MTEEDNNLSRRLKHYYSHTVTDLVDVWCDFCKENHTIQRQQFEANIARNGKYICLKQQGHIVGSKPKKKKINPYAAEGKKQCNECLQIKLFEEFGKEKNKPDGYATRCKTCRAAKNIQKYHEKKT